MWYFARGLTTCLRPCFGSSAPRTRAQSPPLFVSVGDTDGSLRPDIRARQERVGALDSALRKIELVLNAGAGVTQGGHVCLLVGAGVVAAGHWGC